MKKPLVLIIMDGFGINSDTEGNAITAAKTPNLTRLFAENPYTTLGASGMDVGRSLIAFFSELAEIIARKSISLKRDCAWGWGQT